MTPTGLSNIVLFPTVPAIFLRELRRCDHRKTTFSLSGEGLISLVFTLPDYEPRTIAPLARRLNDSIARICVGDAADEEFKCRFSFGDAQPRSIELLLVPHLASELNLTPADDGTSLPQIRSVVFYTLEEQPLRVANPQAWRNAPSLRRKPGREHAA